MVPTSPSGGAFSSTWVTTFFALDRTRKYGMKYLRAVPVKNTNTGPAITPLNERKLLEIGSFRRSAVGKDVLFSLSPRARARSFVRHSLLI